MTASPITPRLRILMLLESEFPLQRGGGSEIQVRTLGEALVRRGHRVSVLTPRLARGPQATASRHGRLAVGRIAYPRVRVLGSLVLLARLGAFLVRHGRRYDVVHVHIAHHLAVVVCAVAPWARLRSVIKVSGWWELGQGLMRPDPGLFARALRPLWRRADAWQAISTRIAGSLAGLGIAPERIHALPNAVDLARFAPPGTAREPTAPLTFVYVGRLSQEKGVEILLRAWAEVFAQRPDRRLWLVGTGPAGDALEALAATLGCAGNVEFLGHRADVAPVIGAADCGLLPSFMEGLSNTLLEFMASGLPVIASRVSGSEDLVRPGSNGWLHEPGDVQSLAAALRAAGATPREAIATMGRHARADVERYAGVDDVVDRLLGLYAPGAFARFAVSGG
ncbi:MAG: glycosyltransferase [Lysobacterales bacterium]